MDYVEESSVLGKLYNSAINGLWLLQAPLALSEWHVSSI